MRRTLVALVALVAAAMLVGCGGAPDEEVIDVRAEYALSAEQALVEAKAAGASEAQIADIEAAIATGEVTLEAARASVDRVAACFESAGLSVTIEDRTGANGVTIPQYYVGAGAVGDDAVTPLMDKCESLENFWTNMLYQVQPSAIEANWAYIESQMPAMIACFEEEGFPAEEGLSARELMDHAIDVMIKTDGRVDCPFRVGIEGW